MAKIRRFGLLRNNFVPDSRPCVNTFHVVITRPLYLLNVFDDLCCNFSVGVFVDLFFIYVGESGFFLYFGNFVAIFLGSVVNSRLSISPFTFPLTRFSGSRSVTAPGSYSLSMRLLLKKAFPNFYTVFVFLLLRLFALRFYCSIMTAVDRLLEETFI